MLTNIVPSRNENNKIKMQFILVNQIAIFFYSVYIQNQGNKTIIINYTILSQRQRRKHL